MIGGAIERCSEHGLVLGPDGMCVLCRSKANHVLSRRVWLGIIAVVSFASLTAAAAWLWRAEREREREQRAAMVPATAIHPWIELPMAAPTSTPAEPGTRRYHFAPRDGSSAEASPSPPVASARPVETRADSTDDRATRVQAAMQDVSVTLYGADWCSACQHAKQWLRQHDIRYEERNVESPSVSAELRRLNPGGKLPTMQIDGAVLSGFSPSSLQSAIRKAAEARVARNAY